jgi:LDH2 family malate/lactate/ureidoglycolate dehydrogenase
MTPVRYDAASLVAFARELLERSGVRADIAQDVAAVLVDGDLLGHTTHGLALLPGYLEEIAKGSMAKAGEPRVINSRAATQAWDGGRLPGPWLTLRALDAAVAIIESSDPIVAAVVPHGGMTPFITPNPVAAGLPTSGDPILVDVSTSITSMGYAKQRMEAGERLPGSWAIDGEGRATDDPGVLWNEPKGALLPLGGIDAGHKGFGLALMIEALTAGLAGFGRADPKEGWGATVFVQVLDPEAFAGRAAFVRQMDFIAASARDAKPRPGVERVRLPGEGGLARHREQKAKGVALYPAIMPALVPWAEKLAVAVPEARVERT